MGVKISMNTMDDRVTGTTHSQRLSLSGASNVCKKKRLTENTFILCLNKPFICTGKFILMVRVWRKSVKGIISLTTRANT